MDRKAIRRKSWKTGWTRRDGRSHATIFTKPTRLPGNGEAFGIAPGVSLWREKFSPLEQKALLDEVLALRRGTALPSGDAGHAKPFSAEESNFGALGWVADKRGYRYQLTHPMTGNTRPANSQGIAGAVGRDQ